MSLNFTASIVVHDTSPDQLKTVLDCLQKTDLSQIYIIDNSDRDSLKTLVGKYPKTDYHHVENRGYGAGHNIAISKSLASGAKYHLVLNADVRWESEVLETLIEQMERDPEIGLISPKVLYPDGRLQYSCRMLPTPVDMMIRLLPEKFCPKLKNRYLLRHYSHTRPLNCPYLLGSFLLFRNDALKDGEWFDELFFMYPEDIDISRRLHERWKTLYYPFVEIIHEHQQASKKSLRMFKIHTVNMIKYFNKWGWLRDESRKKYNQRLLDTINRIDNERDTRNDRVMD